MKKKILVLTFAAVLLLSSCQSKQDTVDKLIDEAESAVSDLADSYDDSYGNNDLIQDTENTTDGSGETVQDESAINEQTATEPQQEAVTTKQTDSAVQEETTASAKTDSTTTKQTTSATQQQTTTNNKTTTTAQTTTKQTTTTAQTTTKQTTTTAQTTTKQTTTAAQQESTTASSVSQGGSVESAQVSLCNITVSSKAQTQAATIVGQVINSSMTELQKVKAIHDWLVNNVEYEINYNNSQYGDAIYTAEGALCNKKAVCQGYAEAFALLCYKAGIQAEMVYGKADNGAGAGLISHAWNQVRVDNEWFLIDITWDDPISDGSTSDLGTYITYEYFLLPESIMNQDHYPETYTIKYSCTSTKYVDYAKQLSLESMLNAQGISDYTIVSTEAQVKEVALNKHNAKVSRYTLAFSMTGQSWSNTNSIISNICEWVKAANGGRLSGYEYFYDEASPYIVITINTNE